jgi:hypothetical protein
VNPNVIENIVEPSRLLLVWQGPEGSSRTRHVIGELSVDSKGEMTLRYSTNHDVLEAARKDGFQGHPAFRDVTQIHTSGVAEAFRRRIPPRTRGDFGAYLAQLRLPPDAALSDFALLGYSGARLPSDGLSLLHTFENHSGPFQFVTEVAGFRHNAPLVGLLASDLALQEPVSLVPEPANVADPAAVQVTVRGKRIGYVMRGLQKPMNEWLLRRSIQANVDRINGRPDRPTVYVFMSVGPDGSANASTVAE